MLFENSLFYVLKNKKQKIVFGWQTCFLLWKIENCSKKQFPTGPYSPLKIRGCWLFNWKVISLKMFVY